MTTPERELNVLLRELAARTPAPLSGAMEERLLRAFDNAHRRRQAGAVQRFGPLWAAAASALLVFSGALLWDLAGRRDDREAAAPTAPPIEFTPLPGASGLPDLESGHIVHVEVPLAALPAYGLIVHDATGEPIEADVLIGQDGLPRAVRVIP